MTRIGIDLNATAARGVLGSVGDYPLPLPLEPPAHELPMVIQLETSTAEVGHAGLKGVRQNPHLVCQDFLASLGETGPKAKRWLAGRHKLDADAALTLVLKKLQPICKVAGDVVMTLPGYLGRPQAEVVHRLAGKMKIGLASTITAPLAAALVSYAEQAWVSSAIVIDVDDHALTLAHVRAVDGVAQIEESKVLPSLGLKAWKNRLVNALADVCVWQTRRDPRDTPQTEQRLYDQLDSLLEASLQGRVLQIGVQGTHWYQNLLISPEQSGHFCATLVRSLQAELERFLHGFRQEEAAPVFVLTHAAGRLPGLAGLLRKIHDASERPPVAAARVKPKTKVEDFGEDLMNDSGLVMSGTVILSADALARAAHGHFADDGEHHEDDAPLPLPLPVDAGPARLHHQGQNFYLSGGNFFVGSQAGCHLLLDHQRHPEVAPRHCDITFEQRSFILHNRSHEGTLVNDGVVQHSIVLQPGDWVRLGGQGPMVRFLGQNPWRAPKVTTA